MRVDHLVLVQQGQLAGDFQHALDDEHDIGPAGIVFIEHKRDGMLDRPRQNTLAVFRHLFAVAQHDGVLADQIDTADVTVQVDAHARPVKPRCDLFDMGRFSGAVITLDHHPAVMGKPGQNGARRLGIENITLVERRHVIGGFRVSGNLDIRLDTEQLVNRNHDVRLAHGQQSCFCGLNRHDLTFTLVING